MSKLTPKEQQLIAKFVNLTSELSGLEEEAKELSFDRELIVRELYQNGRTQAEVGELLGISQSRVNQLLSKRNNGQH